MDHAQTQLHGFGQPVQEIEQNDRVHSPGDGDDDAVSPADPELPESGLYVGRKFVDVGV